MSQLIIILALFLSTIVDGQIVLGEIVEYPANFQRLYELVEMGEHGWMFDECEPTGSRLYWNSAVTLFENTEKEFEDRAFDMLLFLMLAPKEYTYDICGDREGKPILFGPGVTEFLTWYGNPEKYEQERLPIIAEGVVENLSRLMYIFGVYE